uniref:Uncharacterized protein n=1 Tax=Helianthus annuus TaxID=4232 RepID=A0A251U6I6_HELAN
MFYKYQKPSPLLSLHAIFSSFSKIYILSCGDSNFKHFDQTNRDCYSLFCIIEACLEKIQEERFSLTTKKRQKQSLWVSQRRVVFKVKKRRRRRKKMLTCITCSKQQVDDEGQEMGARGSKDAVKNLTTQGIKDLARFSRISRCI